MAFGIQNVTAPNLTTIIDIANETDYTRLAINVNHEIYGGYLFFTLLWVIWIILFWGMNERNNQVLQNALYSGYIVSVISLLLRAIEISESGLAQGLVTDRQMWLFPLITAILLMIAWMTRRAESG